VEGKYTGSFIVPNGFYHFGISSIRDSADERGLAAFQLKSFFAAWTNEIARGRVWPERIEVR
jgi:hypothetical protein